MKERATGAAVSPTEMSTPSHPRPGIQTHDSTTTPAPDDPMSSIPATIYSLVTSRLSAVGRGLRDALDTSHVTAMHVIAVSVLIVALCMLVNTVMAVMEMRASRSATKGHKSPTRRSARKDEVPTDEQDDGEDEEDEEKTRRPVTRSARNTASKPKVVR